MCFCEMKCTGSGSGSGSGSKDMIQSLLSSPRWRCAKSSPVAQAICHCCFVMTLYTCDSTGYLVT
jgi:hypothetical protein